MMPSTSQSACSWRRQQCMLGAVCWGVSAACARPVRMRGVTYLWMMKMCAVGDSLFWPVMVLRFFFVAKGLVVQAGHKNLEPQSLCADLELLRKVILRAVQNSSRFFVCRVEPLPRQDGRAGHAMLC